jgi:hypothetical protein
VKRRISHKWRGSYQTDAYVAHRLRQRLIGR